MQQEIYKQQKPVKNNRVWVTVWISFTLSLTVLPLVWGLLATPPGQQFTGLLFNANDGNTYLAKMEEGRQGAWVFHLAYTSEKGGDGAVTYVFYLLLGKLAGLLYLSNILVFHVARVVCGFYLLLMSYKFITFLLTDPRQQRFAFRLVCLASGLGWLLIFVEGNPPDFWVAEAYTFLSIFANPHFPLATALLIVSIHNSLVGLEKQANNFYLKASLAAFVLGFVHPFLLFTLAGVLGLSWLRLVITRRKVEWHGLISLGIVGVCSTPGAFLTWWGVQHDPLLQAWMSQNQTPSLDLLTTLGGYGLLVPLGLVGWWWIERILPRDKNAGFWQLQRWRTVSNWLFVSIISMALPVSFSRRFIEGVHLPLCCLATVGCYWLTWGWLKGEKRWLVFLMSLSSIAIVVIAVALIYLPHTDLTDPVHSPYLSAGEVGAINWLDEHSPPDEVVLTGPILGNVLPGRVPVRVFYGHSMETIDPDKKLAIIKQFFALATPSAARIQLISSWHLKYLLYGWRERQLGNFDPSTAGWPLLYNTVDVKIYLLSP